MCYAHAEMLGTYLQFALRDQHDQQDRLRGRLWRVVADFMSEM